MTRRRRMRSRGSRGRTALVQQDQKLPPAAQHQQHQQQDRGYQHHPQQAQQAYDPDVHHQVFMEGYNTAIGDYERNKQRIYNEARQRAFREATRGPYLATVRQNGYREGYDIGFQEGEKAGMVKVADVDEFYTSRDIQGARNEGFQEGVFVGRAQAKASEKARRGEPEHHDRAKLIEEMVDQCNIISASNPNMAPGVNAVRHRIKKLGRK